MIEFENQPIILCAQQKSGTTVLQKAFNDTDHCLNFGEVFHEKIYDVPTNEVAYFNFKRFVVKDNPELSTPHMKNQNRLFKMYFENLSNLSNKPFFLMDIKYNSWHHFNPVWHSAMEIPRLLRMVKENNIPIIHIKRKNLLHQYLISFIDNGSEDFFLKPSSEKQIYNEIIINPHHCKQMIQIVKRNMDNFQNWLANYPNHHVVYYEDILIDDHFTDSINNIVAEVTNRKVTKLCDPLIKKNLENPFKYIKNRDQLINSLKNSAFEVYL